MADLIHFPTEFGCRFSVSVDTEEEFDWGGKLTRHEHDVAAADALHSGQRYFESAGVVPIYYVDQPIVESDVAVAVIAPAVASGRAEAGVHLHPWVTPPFIERVNRFNSYVGNLDPEVERAKLRTISDAITRRIGTAPIAYRAGRYGIGPNSYRILAEEGFRCDSSIRPLFDYSDDGGPDFRNAEGRPHWADSARRIIELPLSVHYVGWAGRLRAIAFRLADRSATLRAAAARSGLVARIPLTPEGTPAHDACRMIDCALDQNVRLFNMSFHSPSLAVGHTPYVRDEGDLAAFYRWFDTVFDHCARRGIIGATIAEIVAAADSVCSR